MKISNSKKQLARIIRENGGWRDGVEFSVSTCDGVVIGSGSKPKYTTKYGWVANGGFFEDRIKLRSYLKNWHQTIVSRDEYFHLYPAPVADGWIEWKGGECPVGEGDRIDVKFSDGDEFFDVSSYWGWGADAGCCNIIAYRLHKPEQAKPEFCESVMRSIPETTAKPTIEQLAADYRNRKDYAERKQKEADDAKADADEKLRVLEIAGEAHGLLVSPITEKQEHELVITDWRDLQVGDEIEYLDGGVKHKIGMIGAIDKFDHNSCTDRFFRIKDGYNFGWPTKWRFIRRP